jgi:transcriptional regulator with XRE-family HTH domain/KaiC/GvpD/RAD55 family RecA-like ATPase
VASYNERTVSSGIGELDRLLGGLFIGDNVVWYDDAGSLASMFCHQFIGASNGEKKDTIYVSFDRSPKNLLDKLGPLAESQHLTILDCFTHGKGNGSNVFTRFYDQLEDRWSDRMVCVGEPSDPKQVMDAVYGLHQTKTGDVRLVFESLTGMQELWGGEEEILHFYSRSCPQLYDLETIAYWVMAKAAHSERLKANINQIAQVAIDLSLKRGRSTLAILKAEKRRTDLLNKPYAFWNDGQQVVFDPEKRTLGGLDIGSRLRHLRKQQGINQKALARLVGVTPSTISQIESNTICPSLPALFKIAETLSVPIGGVLSDGPLSEKRLVYAGQNATEVVFPGLSQKTVHGSLLTPPDAGSTTAAYLVEIAPGATLPSHFFNHKGEEVGYLVSGELRATVAGQAVTMTAGDMIHLTVDTPTQWKNTLKSPASLFWLNLG